jgi:NTE family protein
MSYRLGIVLSGGSARGIAHIGVLKALGERGHEVDCLAGTSTGAIVSAFCAAGLSIEKMLEFFEKRSPFRLSHLSIGKPGIVDTAKSRDDLAEYLPVSFEALGKRIFVTATDMLNGRLVVFDSGSLVPALLASASVPALFTPTEIDGRWYSDGGILDNFPVELLKGHCDVIVGVYANPLARIRPSELTSSLAVVQRALDVGVYSASKAKFSECDVVIRPEELHRYGSLDVKHVREIAEVGYRAALEQMDAVERALEAII